MAHFPMSYTAILRTMSIQQSTVGKVNSGPRVVIIGGGVSGITSGIALKTQLGFDNFAIYEEFDDVGGTWHLNTYPGCASDIATHWYSLSTELNPNWNQTHVSQAELKAYWKNLTYKYHLDHNLSLFSKVVEAEWDVSRQVYRVLIQDVRTGGTVVDYANAIISAIGLINIPYYAKSLQGIRDVFRGDHFHSARWRHDISLRNKRVAVVGNGSSAAQFVPVISEDPSTEVVSFIRTPTWVVPRHRFSYTNFEKSVFKYVPFAMRIYRFILMTRQELAYYLTLSGSPESTTSKRATTILTEYLRKTAPAQYVNALIPNHPPGCKRFVVDTGYLESLHRPNNTLNFDGIAEVTEAGIITNKGELHEFDVIIEATGFAIDQYPIKITGVDGRTVQEYYHEHNGPTAYRGTTIPGFPNFFVILGPNTGTGHGSAIFTEEMQVNYTMQLLSPILRGLASSFEVTHEATDQWNTHVQLRLSNSVWSSCNSWYRAGLSGKNGIIWPGPLMDQWWWLRWPQWEHYKAIGAEKWERKRTLVRFVKRCVLVGAVGVACSWWWIPDKWPGWRSF
ncbi:hypothetical protein BXZ70DRAFT_925982 [Cristinia sonorae]|uniref:Uncharacterized protein n=1 Tax=Cristinia sonorae TaxID=1940300 RepID=A0A8K0USU3_9AGAR|nr:hypothetical protein BXZ70DRAFT_925982 [Cristinia sonorae]